MKVKKLQLQNYGRFDDLTIEFAPNNDTKGNVTIIVGNNGAGKSQILQALAAGFSWFVNELVYENNQHKIVSTKQPHDDYLSFPNEGEFIPQSKIKNNKKKATISIDIQDEKVNTISHNNFHIKIESQRFDENKMGLNGLQVGNFREFIDFYHNNLNNSDFINLPLIAQYAVNRNVDVKNIDLNASSSETPLFGYHCFFDAGADYLSFFQNFRDFEDLENEQQKSTYQKVKQLMEIFEKNKNHQILDDLIDGIDNLEKNNPHPIEYIRQAIELFTDFKNIRIERKGTPKMVVEKDGEKLDVNQLSQGEKSLLALVGDIARRLAILNPSLDNPLQGEGVVLIDEVDLHLHPKWQQNLIDKLTKTFPNVQFILTTHSPHIVSDNPDVLVYILDNGELRAYNNAYGEDVNTLLNGVFGVSEFTPEIAEQFTEVRRAISHKELEKAENIIQVLSDKLSPNNSELLRLQLYLAKAKLTQSKAS